MLKIFDPSIVEHKMYSDRSNIFLCMNKTYKNILLHQIKLRLRLKHFIQKGWLLFHILCITPNTFTALFGKASIAQQKVLINYPKHF